VGAGDGRADPEAEVLLADLGAALCAQVVEAVPAWVEREVDRILDAWATTPGGRGVDRPALRAAAADAGRTAAQDVAARLRTVLAADVDAQSTTPLEVVRAAVTYPTGVLRAAGVPAVVRDAFEEARFPHDLYGLTPASLGVVDPSLTDPARAWGAAKAMAHKARHRGRRP
jgi:hypothetical protein